MHEQIKSKKIEFLYLNIYFVIKNKERKREKYEMPGKRLFFSFLLHIDSALE